MQAACCARFIEDCVGQSTRFGSEQQTVTGSEYSLVVRYPPARAEGPELHRGIFRPELFPTDILSYMGHFRVVQSGPFEAGIVELKSKWANQVQAGAGVGTQADDVTGVGRDFGLIKNDVQHGVALLGQDEYPVRDSPHGVIATNNPAC